MLPDKGLREPDSAEWRDLAKSAAWECKLQLVLLSLVIFASEYGGSGDMPGEQSQSDAGIIGVGTAGCARRPSRQTGRADFPHPAFQLMMLPLRGLNDLGMGRFQTKQPMTGKEGIRPALMISTATRSTTTAAFAQNATQPHADPSVYRTERVPVTVLEVREPTSERIVH